ncbi:MAG TPA: CHASE3 domain-containing protein [Chitinophagaceae bacterium]|nr:CHASE3 domain-containing protein [Chitinophagaceae bacterium]
MALKIKTTISLIIGIILLLLISTLLFSLYTVNKVKSNLKIQVHTNTVIITLKDNLTFLLDAETGERGFIITSDTNYLQPYTVALQNISSNNAQLRSLTKDNPVQQRNLDTLEKYISLKLNYTENLIALKKKGDEKTIKEILISNNGKYFMDQVRSVNDSMKINEERLFEERRTNTNKSIANAQVIFILEGSFALLITLFLATVIFNELNRRTKAEKMLKDYNFELERKNREIEQFAYIASHDLQEPLRSISNFSKLLSEKLGDHPDKKIRDYTGLVTGGATRMSNLIFDLLEYSRIGKDVSKSVIDCDKLVHEVLTDMVADIKENNAEIHVSKLPLVHGYPYLKSLFQNLLSNAIKFHKAETHPVIQISAIDKGSEFQFTIKDNGIGMEKIYHERIFIIFQRLHSRAEYEGTGIGLSQCKKIVELHGGKIWVESEPGKGSTFIFTIPKN